MTRIARDAAPAIRRPPARGGALGLALAALALAAGCSSLPPGPRAPASRPAADGSVPGALPGPAPRAGAPARSAARCGACYLDDGPGDDPPADLAAIPDAVPRPEPLHPAANRPYTVFGRGYVPTPDVRQHRERGHASWYGRKFHGRPTSSGEIYDMYGMTAAHPTLPIPSYVRVTHLRNGRSVVVRVNDRGPFLNRRVIDLTYAAAWRLGYVEAGSAEVEIELLSSPGMHGLLPQTAGRTDGAAPRAVAGPGPGAPGGASGGAAGAVPAPMPMPMLAQAAAERLSVETTIDDRPAAPVGVEPVAAARAGSAPPPGPAAALAATPGTWLQFGAYASRDNAEQARARLQREVPWLLVPAELVQSGGSWRVQVGPWDRREDALALADRIAASGGARPHAVAR